MRRKWQRVLHGMFKLRFDCPMTSKDLWIWHNRKWRKLDIQTWEALDSQLRKQLAPPRGFVHHFKSGRNPPVYSPWYYIIAPAGIRRLAKMGAIDNDKEKLNAYERQVEMRINMWKEGE